mmetsp:Transcript_37872/g.80180  ORF Transcript_37872/g.80180 Transcript_37872/m.80180 type:complete len:214 (+) Transcript_37872:460-1101(+)
MSRRRSLSSSKIFKCFCSASGNEKVPGGAGSKGPRWVPNNPVGLLGLPGDCASGIRGFPPVASGCPDVEGFGEFADAFSFFNLSSNCVLTSDRACEFLASMPWIFAFRSWRACFIDIVSLFPSTTLWREFRIWGSSSRLCFISACSFLMASKLSSTAVSSLEGRSAMFGSCRSKQKSRSCFCSLILASISSMSFCNNLRSVLVTCSLESSSSR